MKHGYKAQLKAETQLLWFAAEALKLAWTSDKHTTKKIVNKNN